MPPVFGVVVVVVVREVTPGVVVRVVPGVVVRVVPGVVVRAVVVVVVGWGLLPPLQAFGAGPGTV